MMWQLRCLRGPTPGVDPTFKIDGSARVKYPCRAGDTAGAFALAVVKLDPTDDDMSITAAANITYFWQGLACYSICQLNFKPFAADCPRTH